MNNARVGTGVAGLDCILNGGLLRHGLHLIQGDPGAGKTTVALQFLLEGVRNHECCLYASLTLSKEEILAVADSHGWSIDKIKIIELAQIVNAVDQQQYQSTFQPADVELHQTIKLFLGEVEKHQPQRVVFDSLAELRLLAQESLRYRRQLIALNSYFANRDCTVVLVDDRSTEKRDLDAESLAHTIVELRRSLPEYGTERRRIRVVKLRASPFIAGNHEFSIGTGGITVYPRMFARNEFRPVKSGVFQSGNEEFDKLCGGGLMRGSATLLVGPAGVGKSTLATQLTWATLKRGEKVIFFSFEEGSAVFRTFRECWY